MKIAEDFCPCCWSRTPGWILLGAFHKRGELLPVGRDLRGVPGMTLTQGRVIFRVTWACSGSCPVDVVTFQGWRFPEFLCFYGAEPLHPQFPSILQEMQIPSWHNHTSKSEDEGQTEEGQSKMFLCSADSLHCPQSKLGVSCRKAGMECPGQSTELYPSPWNHGIMEYPEMEGSHQDLAL